MEHQSHHHGGMFPRVYRAVGDRVAVDCDALRLPMSVPETLTVLMEIGCEVLDVDVIAVARSRVGRSTHRRGASMREAPEIVDCSSFVKWAYGQCGIWIPRRTIQQSLCGVRVPFDDLHSGDLIFRTGRRNYYDTDPSFGMGHVGIVTDCRTVVCAQNKEAGVVEAPLHQFLSDRQDFRGAVRMIDPDEHILTLRTPPNREVETSDDLRWMILERLP